MAKKSGFNPQRGGYKRKDSNGRNIALVKVSIPKGEATNRLKDFAGLLGIDKFQSPKGRLQTYNKFCRVKYYKMFQSPKGRLQTIKMKLQL